MPVGTNGTVKALEVENLQETGSEIILGNTYHLMLRPGDELIKNFGGLHKFSNWDKPILTDSGGFQVWSLGDLAKITEEGVSFQSPYDGKKCFMSPEDSMQIQANLGSDIVMVFDECTPYPCDYDYAKKSMGITHRWLDRCINRFSETSPKYDYDQTLFPIVQGSTFRDLRKESAEYIKKLTVIWGAKEAKYKMCNSHSNNSVIWLIVVPAPTKAGFASIKTNQRKCLSKRELNIINQYNSSRVGAWNKLK